MKINRIRLVVSFAVIALAGILFIQGFWIMKSWHIHLRNYDHKIHQAAVHSARKLEKGHFKQMLDKNREVQIEIIKTEAISSQNEITKERIVIIHSDTLGEKSTRKKKIKRGKSKVKFWESQLEELKIEELINDSNIISEIYNLPIDSIISAELGKENIEQDYSFELINSHENEISKRDDNSNKDKTIVPLFRHTLNDKPVFFKLIVNQNKKPIPTWFVLMIISSILFSGIMIWAFWYVVQGLLKQKKISDIKSDFINNMTHEFKTPISTISLAVDSIDHEKVKSDPEKISYYTSIIRSENKRMNKQVEQILDAAQLEKGELTIRKTQVDINRVLEEIIENFDLIIKEKNGEIKLTSHFKPCLVMGDESHLYNVFNNIIDNAIKYCNQTPEISISLDKRANNYQIEITDNGIGMTQEELKHLFTQFYRVEKGNLHNVKGFGLGLSYVKRIVENHNGSIQVESQPQKGSTFRINLPIS